jgi:hypothetical protein
MGLYTHFLSRPAAPKASLNNGKNTVVERFFGYFLARAKHFANQETYLTLNATTYHPKTKLANARAVFKRYRRMASRRLGS